MAEQPPSLVRYTGPIVATSRHDGGLRPAVGVHHVQVLRANRAHPEWADGHGWTYNHAPMLAYWRGRFFLEYLSGPVSEHTPPGQTLLVTSTDGLHWGMPQVLFPPYRLDRSQRHPLQGEPERREPASESSVMHQRMGFYVAPNGRLLALGFYGICACPAESPVNGRGIGRVVREVYADGSFGPIYFIRYNRHAGWDEANTHYPPYTASTDGGFIAACQALLADKLKTMQWWEEDRSEDGFYTVAGYQAPSVYHLPDGRAVALFKWGFVALSDDEGRSWSPVRQAPSLVMAGAKMWGQRTSDGRYAIVRNPTPDNTHRWPLAIVTGDDGLNFDDLLCVHGQVPPRRFRGVYKDFGPQYVRGIAEGNGAPPDGALWLTYSVNKEDIWVSRVPVPVTGVVREPVRDDFGGEPGSVVRGWNIYAPLWAPVTVADDPERGRVLRIEDRDPYDAAVAERVFPESTQVSVSLRIQAGQTDRPFYIELADGRGEVALRLILDEDGWLKALNAGRLSGVREVTAGQWVDLRIAADAERHTFGLWLDGARSLDGGHLSAPVRSVERLTLRTGPIRRTPTPDTQLVDCPDLPGADEPLPPAVWWLSRVETADHRRA